MINLNTLEPRICSFKNATSIGSPFIQAARVYQELWEEMTLKMVQQSSLSIIVLGPILDLAESRMKMEILSLCIVSQKPLFLKNLIRLGTEE